MIFDRAINPTTDEAYASFARAHSFEATVVDLPKSGGKVLWLGNPSAQKVVVCLHGMCQSPNVFTK